MKFFEYSQWSTMQQKHHTLPLSCKAKPVLRLASAPIAGKIVAKYLVASLLFSIATIGYADNLCANSNPFVQHSCETLQQSSVKAQKERDESYQKSVAKYEETTRKNLEEESKPAETPPPPIPEWQKALKTTAPAKNPNDAAKTKAEKTAKEAEEAPPITPLPETGPAEFAAPEAVKLPGGINILPTKPAKKENKGTVKYY
jgi:hypothetical protein